LDFIALCLLIFTMIARRFLISGVVQGVGFRYFAIRAAQRCGVVGYARNLSDGRVEVVAEGELSAIAALKMDLEQGPSYAHVTGVQEIEIVPTGRFASFGVEF
jgi:acylphosphatase